VTRAPENGCSDWSGKPLPDQHSTVTVILSDGEKRRLRITDDEHARLSALGDRARGPRRWLAAGRRTGPKVVWFVLGLSLTAFVSNEIGKLYADRKQAADIKLALASAINRSSVRMYNEALDVAAASVEREPERALDQRRNRVVSRWLQSSADIDGEIFLHFGHAVAKRDWHAYRAAMHRLMALSHVDRYGGVAELMSPLRDFLPASAERSPRAPSADPWKILGCRMTDCRRSAEWYENYRWLGEQVIEMRADLMRKFLRAHTENLG
jgi:hypothetical protein